MSMNRILPKISFESSQNSSLNLLLSRTRNNLANLLRRLGRYDEASAEIHVLLDQLERANGWLVPRHAQRYNETSSIYRHGTA